MNIKIVCPNSFRFLLKNIEDFKINLGDRYTNRDTKGNMVISIKDNFVNFFRKKYNNIIFKIGEMGIINFYSCNKLSDSQIIIFDENDVEYVFEYDKNLAETNTEKYLSEILQSIKK